MNDLDVGELWRNEIRFHGAREWVLDLVRKLVEEREDVYLFQGWADPGMMALRDFGIDPKEFAAHVTRPEGEQDTLKSVSGSDKDE